MRIFITGGAGFLGSHLCETLIHQGHTVICLDNLLTGRTENIGALMGHPKFSFIHYNVCDYLHVDGPVDAVMHFASPASPQDYLEFPIATMKVGALGTHKALGLAKAKQARFLLASTSEVYGDPLVNPQPETYWGNVNPISPQRRLRRSETICRSLNHRLPSVSWPRYQNRQNFQYLWPTDAPKRWAGGVQLYRASLTRASVNRVWRWVTDPQLLLRR